MKKTPQLTSYLAKEMVFEGVLTFRDMIRIDGRLKGEIAAKGTLIVGETATIHADIHISQIIISGEVHGNIIADHRIDILPYGKVFGDIQAPTVMISEGAVFQGNARRVFRQGQAPGPEQEESPA